MSAKKRVHMVCNAHLDPVWLWHWEDGLTETLSTFRVAADFCEKHSGFLFNHNEAVLYRWVEEHEPQLFRRIEKLVKKGSWHISGGTYLQPDVNNTSGESHIRHYLAGRRYFTEKFGSYPVTACNFDPFGHGEGFPQILEGCGMRNYVFCRPDYGTYDLPVGAFRWRDRSGSEVIARRSDDHYLTNGRMAECLDRFLPHFAPEPVTMILWGIGNHGGGPSEEEYREYKQYVAAHREFEFVESTPDAFFGELMAGRPKLPVVSGEIEKSFPGCYTSMSRVKRAHREAESLAASTERLAALAWWWRLADYPKDDLDIAWRDILFSEFHDILPGSGVPSVEKDSLQLLGHAMENLRRTRFRAQHAMIREEPGARSGEVPVFVANPHGFPVKTQVEFELQLNTCHPDIVDPEITLLVDGKPIPFQRLQAEACCAGDWRVRLAALVKLKPWQIVRIEESYERGKPARYRAPAVSARSLTFKTSRFDLRINPRTGLVDHLSLPGKKKSLVAPGSWQPAYFKDLEHSWTCGDPDALDWGKAAEGELITTIGPGWRKPSARFRLASNREAAHLSPTARDRRQSGRTSARAIRIIEKGPVRTVVEVILVCDVSAVVRQYHIGHLDGRLELRDRVFNNHRDHMLKLLVPLDFEIRDSVAETIYSAAARKPTKLHDDHTQQRWAAVRGKQGGASVFIAVANTGSGAYSLAANTWALNVLRSPAYAASLNSPTNEKLQNRFLPRHDQGEHEMRYTVHLGSRFRETDISRAAQVLNVPPVWQVYYPQPEKPNRKRRLNIGETVVVHDPHVQVVALKKAEKGNDLIIRLQDTLGREREISLEVKPHRGTIRTTIGKHGLATLAVRRGGKKLAWRRVNLVEQRV